ncbi:Alpha-galactosidase [Aphelenchoides besseyi]|nr:Alpha-galactosidase [Aphelenchoides besseyi]
MFGSYVSLCASKSEVCSEHLRSILLKFSPPPMGWRPGIWFSCDLNCKKYPTDCLNELLYVEMADALFMDGYRKAGYTLIYVDDCARERTLNEEGQVVMNSQRFPTGVRFLSNYFHERRLDFGINRGIVRPVCLDKSRRDRFYLTLDKLLDLRTDFVEMNACDPTHIRRASKTMLVYCNGNQPDDKKYPPKFCDVHRPADLPTISDNWQSVSNVIDYAVKNYKKLLAIREKGHWIDFGELTIGNEGLTIGQSRIQMSMWCMWSAPLMMSNDLRNVKRSIRRILLNEKAIDIDQDELGELANLVFENKGLSYFVKKVEPCNAGKTVCSHAVAVINRSNITTTAAFKFSDLGLTYNGPYRIVGVWSNCRRFNSTASDVFRSNVESMDAHMYKITPMDFDNTNPSKLEKKTGRQSFHIVRQSYDNPFRLPLAKASEEHQWYTELTSLIFGWEFVWLFGVILASSIIYIAIQIEKQRLRYSFILVP